MTVQPNTPALRSEIEKALDEIISNEEGMRFQGLAVVLAKQRWPELIACERKKDYGLDAHASSSLATDRIGKGLACSITADVKKIAADAKEAKEHFTDVTALVFATPLKVSNVKKEEWAEQIRKEFGYELHVISREDIIASLMEPANAALCRSFFAIDVEVEAPVADLVDTIKDAAGAEAATWTARTPGPLIGLLAAQIDDVDNDSSQVYTLARLYDALGEGRRLVLEGPAGRGKTTTLAQLASLYTGLGGTAFLVDLPLWVSSPHGILEFIARSPQFQARRIDAITLARVQYSEPFSFLLNGWNEITESNSIQASDKLRELERSFPSAGIIVATRAHHVRPPLPGATRLRLLRITRRQRNDYLNNRLGNGGARTLAAQLDADRELDDLTRTPLVLSGVASVFSAGAAIPKTKLGVLAAVMRLMEEMPEHAAHLRSAPLEGLQHQYLGELAMRMTAQGAVGLPQADARAIAYGVAERLRDARQINALPEPADVLAALCAHHALERVEYPSVSFRFQHQQFQEHHAALDIKRQLLDLATRDNEDRRRDFTATYVNQPAWAEPLRMIAETIGTHVDDATADPREVQAGRALVEMAMTVDLVFAAELARMCGPLVWREIGPALTERLRSWFSVPDGHHQNCALAAMLASGSADFRDIVVPLLSSPDQQVRLRTYRLWSDISLDSLGRDWRGEVASWPDDVRADFVGDLLHNRFVPEIVDFARADRSPAVQKATLDGLIWNRLDDEAARFMETTTGPTLEAVAQQTPPELIPAPMQARALATLQELPDDSTDPPRHLTTVLRMAELGDRNTTRLVKDALERLPERLTEHWMLRAVQQALDILRTPEPEWVSRWVADRIARGTLWAPEHWMPFVSTVPPDLVEACLRKLETEDLQNSHFGGPIAVIVRGADARLAARTFSNLRDLRRTITTAPDARHDFEWQIERQLEALFRDLPPETAIEGALSVLAEPVEAVDIDVTSRLFSRVARHDAESIAGLDARLKTPLRAYVKRALPVVLQQDDYDGWIKANVASLIAQVGEPEDVDDLLVLVRADIERVRLAREARAAGGRGPRARHNMGQAPWHIRAIIEHNAPRTDDVLLELLRDDEYGRWVAEELPKLLYPQPVGAPFGNKIDFNAIWEARAGRRRQSPNEARRARYAAALRDLLARSLDERLRAQEQQPNYYLLKELAKHLAAIDARDSTDLVLRVMSLPGRGDGWQRASALESMLFAGVAIPVEPVLAMFDDVLQQAQRNGLQDNERWLVNRFLCICPFVDAPARGIQKIRDAIGQQWVYHHELRDIATAVGHSRAPEALDFLRDLAAEPVRAEQLDDAWTNAVAALDTPASRKLLMSFVDPDIPGLPIRLRRDDVLAARIVECARPDRALEARLLALCALDLPEEKRRLLSKVINWLGGEAAVTAALNLLDDRAPAPVEYETWEQLENAFVEKKPYGQASNTYTLAARASNDIRLRLFDMAVRDPRRQRAARSLLGQIEEWRLEYGRPIGEPRHPAFGSRDPWPPAEPQ